MKRIRREKEAYREVGSSVPDGALVKDRGCASRCPAEDITFGNARDPNSTISKIFQDERAYAMLSELNTKPGVRYLARISHSEVKEGHGGGH